MKLIFEMVPDDAIAGCLLVGPRQSLSSSGTLLVRCSTALDVLPAGLSFKLFVSAAFGSRFAIGPLNGSSSSSRESVEMRRGLSKDRIRNLKLEV